MRSMQDASQAQHDAARKVFTTVGGWLPTCESHGMLYRAGHGPQERPDYCLPWGAYLKTGPSIWPIAIHCDNVASASANTSVPRAMSSGDAYSSGRWLYPLRHGMNNMAAGAMRDMKSES
jgi:hypothetical protein